jgi:hypothetical protein
MRHSTSQLVDVPEAGLSDVTRVRRVSVSPSTGEDAAAFDRALEHRKMQVYTGWCFAAMFALIGLAQCVTWLSPFWHR